MWTVTLGPTNQNVPDSLWDEFRERGLLFHWDVYCKAYGGEMNAYYVFLTRVDSTGKKQSIDVGQTILTSRPERSWNAFGSGGWPFVDGFATRRYAIEYMLKVQGYQNSR